MRNKSRTLIIFALVMLLGTAFTYAQNTGKVNINTASVEQLVELPGIGESTANNIVDYRKKNGNFKSIDQLLEVKGVGEKKLSKIKNMLTL